MKKILYSAMMLSLMLASSCSKDKERVTWDTSLGKASFATDKIWEISSGTFTQKWSDAVEIIGAKSTYDGGDLTDGYKAGFCSNPGQKGSLFSWRAVAEIVNICPSGWRVPTTADFVNLDKALGGTGNDRTNLNFVNNLYVTLWGGAFGGWRNYLTLVDQGSQAYYWSQSEKDADFGFVLTFSSAGKISPQSYSMKNLGYTLRCVRN